jgi:hypothetical protein
VIRTIPVPDRLLLAGLGLSFAALSVASGVIYVSAGQHDVALTWMTVGWLGALIAYAVSWRVSGRAIDAERPAADLVQTDPD